MGQAGALLPACTSFFATHHIPIKQHVQRLADRQLPLQRLILSTEKQVHTTSKILGGAPASWAA